ncbi:hypothetical protein LshimejAT787_2100510 [Lyophyllum shimeji]|uniref:Uncharacterized protein n=1 Tax=Lyophyllum shimeji TaxID=47721 RepID=A0A9P3Q0Y6_LYOSH|nr:hypothetical protein LshimejAT787_2100510 [Lyophyllum shimeji]
MSLLFIYSISTVGDPRPPQLLPIRPPPRSYLAQAKQRKAAIAAAVELERTRIRIRENWETYGFRFKRLPPELQLMVLAFSAEWPETYRALVLVSRYMCHATQRACIPRMPVTLSTSKQLSAFASLVQRDARVGDLVHNLWISPLRREDSSLAYRILRACTNVRVLACDAWTLAATIANVKPTRLRHTMCRDLTLLLRCPEWESAMNTPHGLLFLRQLTHLRVVSEQTVPRELPLDNLTHLSYSTRRRPDDEDIERPWALSDRKIFPSLRQVVLTKRCGPEEPSAQKVKSKVVLLYVSRERTEMEMWCDMAAGQSIWHKASKASPVPKKPA